MDVTFLAMLFVQATAETSTPPAGNPSAPWVSVYGGPDKWRVHWTNGDAAAYTRVYYGAVGVAFGDATFLASANPGITSADTGLETGLQDPVNRNNYTFWFVHYRDGEESDTPVSLDTTGLP